MKRYYIYNTSDLHKAFGAIRTKTDIINLQLYILQRFLLNEIVEDKKPSLGSPDAVIHIDKMSRVFCCEEVKIHSFQFPFLVNKSRGRYIISHSNYNIDNAMITILLSIFQNDLVTTSFESINDLFLNAMCEFDVDDEQCAFCWDMIMHLLSHEPGYIRYDYDPNVSRVDEVMHPENHIDFYYEGNNTFKLGLHDLINYEELIDLVDINKRCIYLKDI